MARKRGRSPIFAALFVRPCSPSMTRITKEAQMQGIGSGTNVSLPALKKFLDQVIECFVSSRARTCLRGCGVKR